MWNKLSENLYQYLRLFMKLSTVGKQQNRYQVISLAIMFESQELQLCSQAAFPQMMSQVCYVISVSPPLSPLFLCQHSKISGDIFGCHTAWGSVTGISWVRVLTRSAPEHPKCSGQPPTTKNINSARDEKLSLNKYPQYVFFLLEFFHLI